VQAQFLKPLSRVSVLALLAAVTACGSPQGEASAPSEPTGGATASPADPSVNDPLISAPSGSHAIPASLMNGFPVLDSARSEKMPIAPYLFDREENRVFSGARSLLIDRCVARFGIPSLSIPKQAVKHPAPNQMELRYFLTDAQQARVYGYDTTKTPWGIEQQQRSERQQQHETELASQFGEDLGRILSGSNDDGTTATKTKEGQAIPPGGCAGEADRALGVANAAAGAGSAGVPGYSGRARLISLESWDNALKDRRVRAVFKNWATCMAVRGFSYADPLAASNDPAWRDADTADRQRATASADVECKQLTNVVGVWYGVESEIENKQISRFRTELENLRASNQIMVQRARDVIASE
jgi:hypothetical protein